MIIFDLCCGFEHRFEGWFASADAFADQVERQLVSCPVCGTTAVHRVPSAIHMARPGGGIDSDKADSELQRLVSAYRSAVGELLRGSEDVGARFAEEARRIHRDEAPDRRIHGYGSNEEFEALQEEGIDVMKVIVFKTGKKN